MTQTTQEPAQSAGHWWVVLAACTAVFVVAYNTTAVMTVLPAMKSSLDLSADTLEWVINIYMLSTAVTLAAMGHFADTFGMLRIFAIGLCSFALGSIVIALAGDAAIVLTGRAFQGIGVAGLLSTSVALINNSTPEDQRSQALGLWAGALAVGFAAGPMIGGSLADAISWRAIFALDIVILAAAALLCLFVARAGLVPKAPDAKSHIDTPGIFLLFVTLAAFLYGLTSGQLNGWTSVQTLALLATAVVGGGAFAYRELHARDPLVNFGFFEHADYVAGTTGMILNGFVQMGVLYFFNLFMQSPEGFGFTAAQAGLGLLPFTIAMLAVSLTAPRLLPPNSLGWALTFGMATIAVGFWLMHDIDSQTHYGDLWWRLAILGVGVGFNWSLLARVGLRDLPTECTGQGSGVLTTCNFIGLATGTAIGGLVTSRLKHGSVDPVIDRLTSHVPDLGSLKITLVHGSESQIARALAKVSPDDAEKIKAAMQTGFDNAFSGVMVMMAIAGLLGAVLCVTIVRK